MKSAAPVADRQTSRVIARLPWVLSLLASMAMVAVAVVWLTVPRTYPYGSGDIARAGINHLIERGPAVVMLLTFAVVGILLAVIALRGDATRPVLRVAGTGAVVESVFFAFVMSDSSVMSSLGYVVALAAPVGVAVVVVLACRRRRRAGLVVAASVLVLASAGLTSGTLNTLGEAVATYLGGFLSDAGGYYVRSAWAIGMAAVAAGWAWAAVATLREVPTDRPDQASGAGAMASRARRWGRVVTIAAALGPVPYGLARLTWLTPWPLGGGGGIDGFVISRPLTAPERIQGGLFALACAVGVILTLGLIRRWGEVFPGWVPVLSGRAVPVLLAVVPGTLVASVITISAPGMLLGPIEEGDAREVAYMLVAFPFPVWGPLLGAAVYAYWLRRTQEPGTGPRPLI